MMPARDVVVEREDRDGGLADREGRSRDDGRQQSLEPLSRFGQFGRRRAGCRHEPRRRHDVRQGERCARRQSATERAPVSDSPADRRSIHSRPSGLSITSTTAGSSRNAAMSGPSAVRSMRAPRVTASALHDAFPYCPRHRAGAWTWAGHRGRIEEAGTGMTQQDQSGCRSKAKKYRRTAVSAVRRTTRCLSTALRDGLAKDSGIA